MYFIFSRVARDERYSDNSLNGEILVTTYSGRTGALNLKLVTSIIPIVNNDICYIEFTQLTNERVRWVYDDQSAMQYEYGRICSRLECEHCMTSGPA